MRTGLLTAVHDACRWANAGPRKSRRLAVVAGSRRHRRGISLGLRLDTAAYDCNADQLDAVLEHVPAERFEVVVHQHEPMLHMAHCVFAAILSCGADYGTCGRPCERHDVTLQDHTGAILQVRADIHCRNMVFNSPAQSGAL